MRGYILAGGRSSRFGSDKALYLVAGEALIVRTARVLAEAGLVPIVVARHARNLGLVEMIEPGDDDDRHPLWGVALALSLGEDAFITPVDLPELSAGHVRALIRARAVAVGQPLLGWFPAALADRARTFTTAGRSVRAFVEDLPMLDLGPILNLNR